MFCDFNNDLIINRQEEAYYTSLPVFFEPDDGSQSHNSDQLVSLDAVIEPVEIIRIPLVDFEAVQEEFFECCSLDPK